MGLAEIEWLESIDTFDSSHITYEPFVDCAKWLTKYFREVEKVDYVIALTHIWTDNDILLAKNIEGIDIFLGGHDHTTVQIVINNNLIKKSGCDFREFSLLTLEKRDRKDEDFCHNPTTNVATNWLKIDITKEFEPHPDLEVIVHNYTSELNKKLDKLCGFVDDDLELRFSRIWS